jgi:protocatechuate 3,4-dioxygenase beta subunit
LAVLNVPGGGGTYLQPAGYPARIGSRVVAPMRKAHRHTGRTPMTVHEAPHHRGLDHDFPLLRRRRMMGLAGGTTVAALAALALGEPAWAATAPTTATAATAAEPTGPANAGGSAGFDDSTSLLSRSGIVRSDIRRGFGTATGAAQGVPLTLKLRLTSANSGKAIAGQAVYLWHCDRDGDYSLYAPALTGQNYLRGVQASDEAGWVSFTSIFPGAYAGRWPHVHFEVYPSVATATGGAGKLHTSQLALPADVCDKVYATAGYAESRKNLSRSNLATDNVFAAGRSLEMAAVTGDVTRGFVATRTVGI